MMRKTSTPYCKTFERVMNKVLNDLKKESHELTESLQEVGVEIGVGEAISVHIGQLGETIWEKCLRKLGSNCVLKTPGSRSPADIWEYVPSNDINLYQVKASATQDPPDPSEKDAEKLQKLKEKVEIIAHESSLPFKRVNVFWVKIKISISSSIQDICAKKGYKDKYECLNSMFESGEIKIEQCNLDKPFINHIISVKIEIRNIRNQ